MGNVAFHNTIVKCGDAFAVYAGVRWSRAFFRNNLFLGGAGGGTYGGYGNGTGQVMVLADADATCDFDHDGFGSVGTGMFRGRIGDTRFASLAELTSTTTEVHTVEVGLDVFATMPEALASGPFPERAVPDLRLAAGGAAIDRGTALANVNDGFAGSAPDLGAYELGSALPPYGPRTAGSEVCGDGVREGTEACDDGNARDGDGCSSSCTIEAMPGADAGPLDAGAGVDGAAPVDAALPRASTVVRAPTLAAALPTELGLRLPRSVDQRPLVDARARARARRIAPSRSLTSGAWLWTDRRLAVERNALRAGCGLRRAARGT